MRFATPPTSFEKAVGLATVHGRAPAEQWRRWHTIGRRDARICAMGSRSRARRSGAAVVMRSSGLAHSICNSMHGGAVGHWQKPRYWIPLWYDRLAFRALSPITSLCPCKRTESSRVSAGSKTYQGFADEDSRSGWRPARVLDIRASSRQDLCSAAGRATWEARTPSKLIDR